MKDEKINDSRGGKKVGKEVRARLDWGDEGRAVARREVPREIRDTRYTRLKLFFASWRLHPSKSDLK